MFRYLLLILFFSGCKNEFKHPRIVIHTSFGNIELEVYPSKAPQSSTAFLSFIDSGYYNNASFYRVIKTEQLTGDNTGIIQGGVHFTSKKFTVEGVTHEGTGKTGLSHTDGTISLARTKPGTAGTEFFICIGDQSFLDQDRRGTKDRLGMAAFGKVLKGMSVVRRIQKEAVQGDRFLKPILISKVTRL